MCDKLQSSKDGSVDLCHGHAPEYSSSRSVQQYSRSSNSNSVSYRKQRKHYGKDKSTHSRPDSDGPNRIFSGRSNPGRHFHAKGNSWQGSPRQGQKKIKEQCGDFPVSKEGTESGKRKAPHTSLNHLLNFTVASSERRYSGRGDVYPVVRHRKRNTSHSYNKEEFLQANCQFVVSASGEYTVHFRDPDKLVEWDCIEQVRLFCQEIPSCPICLYPPRAAKITRCGHVYCWSCLLHYLSLGEKKWSKCPICNESIYRKDIKSIAALSSPRYEVGDSISFKLMVREKGTTKVSTREDWKDNNCSMSTIEDSQVNQFVKLVSATPEQVLSCITGPEKEALLAQIAGLGEEEASERCFIETALQDLKERESELVGAQTVRSEVEKMLDGVSGSLKGPALTQDPVCPDSADHPPTTWTSFAEQYFEGGFEDPFPDPGEDSTDSVQFVDSVKGGASHCCPDSGDNPTELATNISTASSQSSPRSCSSEGSDLTPSQATTGDLVYFYQASDGQHFYMHPVNVKCLSKEYGGLEHSPGEITAKILELEQLTMSEELRGRYKALSHLPLTCEFALCELELKLPLVSQDTLEHFATEIYRRKQKRVKKKKEERRHENKAKARHTAPEPTFRVPSALELTPEKFHDYLSLASSPPPLGSGSPKMPTQSGQSQDDAAGALHVVGTPPAPSFAQALQAKWPVKESPKDMLIQQPSPQSSNTGDESSVPSLQDAFNEAFETASDSVWAMHRASGGKPGTKTAKKGRKKLVLFSTGGSRGAS